MTPASISRVVVTVALTALAVAPAATQAQEDEGNFKYLIPFDVSTGVVFGRGSPNPFTLALRTYPSLTFGRSAAWRFGPSVAVIYTNPQWDVGFGARGAVRLMAISRRLDVVDIGLYLALEQLWVGGGPQTSTEVFVNLGELLRIGARVTLDWETDDVAVLSLLAVELRSFIELLSEGEVE